MSDQLGGAVPADFGLALDGGVRRIDGGSVLVGGYPLRVLRLSPAGAGALDIWAAGGPVGTGFAHQRLARRLLDAGMAHPRPAPGAGAQAAVTLVIPTRDRPAGLARVLESVTEGAVPGGGAGILVVDDGSVDADAVAEVARRHGARLLRRERPGGPAAARNAGWRAAGTELIAFLDDDCRSPGGPGWTAALLDHLLDPGVGLVAPRIRAGRGEAPAWLAAYERVRSPLDRGPRPAVVRPGGPVPFLPGAALVVRRSALEQLHGFDETLTVGEDVDLIWRLGEAGWTVRYEPAVIMSHPCRPGLASWSYQRYRYGTSAAALDTRHPGAATPLSVSAWTAAAWALVSTGGPAGTVAGVALAAGTTVLLVPRLRSLGHPWREAARLAGRGHWAAGRLVSDAARRAWWPLLAGLAIPSRRARRTSVAAAILVPLLEVMRGEHRDRGTDADAGPVSPLTWVILRLADDLAYGAGLWAGSARQHRLGALRPRFSSWPGRTPAVQNLTAPGPSQSG